MLKLSNTQRNWVVLAVIAWLVVLAGLIFIPMSNPDAARASAPTGPQVAPTNSLEATLERTPHTGGATMAVLLNPAAIYDTNTYAGFNSLCPNEPQDLIDAKLEAFKIEKPELDDKTGYVVVLPPDENDPILLDRVDLTKVDICTTPMMSSAPLEFGLPAFYEDGKWNVLLAQ